MCNRKRAFVIFVGVTLTYICLFNFIALYSLSHTSQTRISLFRKNGQLYLGHFYFKNWTCKPVRLSRQPLPLTALASFPGSGNTWIRHLLQQATGIATGSVYKDTVLQQLGFPGEGVLNKSVLVVKTHQWGEKERKNYERSILLIRDPFNALLSEFNRQYGGHLGHAQEMHFKKEWKSYVFDAAKNWMALNRDWLNFSGPLYIVHYEDFKSDPANQLSRLLKFLNIEISNSNLLCVMKNIEGFFKRTKMRTVKTNPFSKIMRDEILDFKRQLKLNLDIFDTKRKINDRE